MSAGIGVHSLVLSGVFAPDGLGRDVGSFLFCTENLYIGS